MKVLLYEQNAKLQKKSGIGRALRHQKKALEMNGIETTFNVKDQYDLVHINSNFPKSYRLLKKCLKKNIPVVVHGHSTYEDFRESFRLWRVIEPFFDHCLTKMYHKAPLIITPTPYSKKLIENYPCTECPVLDISNGIDLEEYSHNEKYIEAYRQHFGIKEGDKVVIGVGLLFKRKGIHDFIEIARKMPDIKFIWFGHLQKILCSSFINRAIKNKPSNVIMPGYIDGAIIKGAMQDANLMLFPTYEETEGIVALEALASSTPLLIRDIPCFDGWLENQVNCYKAKSNEEFINQINFICSHDNSSIVSEGYKVAQERSLDLIGKKLIETYNQATKISQKSGK